MVFTDRRTSSRDSAGRLVRAATVFSTRPRSNAESMFPTAPKNGSRNAPSTFRRFAMSTRNDAISKSDPMAAADSSIAFVESGREVGPLAASAVNTRWCSKSLVTVFNAAKNGPREVLSSGWSCATWTSSDASSKSESIAVLASRILARIAELTGPRFSADE